MYDIRVNRRTIVCMTREARLSCRGYDRWPARSAEPLIVAVRGSWGGGATGEVRVTGGPRAARNR